jgi:uncharacterized cupredoxin-like copper-binding protein
MMQIRPRRQLLALALLAPLAPWARAHGSRPHGHQGHHAPLVKEQKPWGIAAEPREARRTIEILMTDDMRFAPAHIDVREGETLRLRAVNRGRVMHEIVIGTRQELEEHAEMMNKHPNMEHDEPYMAHVVPGQRGDIVWTFNRPGNFEFACLIPGHFEAGMRGTIRVRPRNG